MPSESSGLIRTNVLECIGNTPIVRLNTIPKEEGLSCEILAKCEFFNAGGSVKDRIAKRMIESAETEGLLHPHSTIIEPTSGNTGIGLALAGALKGYKVVITMPEKMSNEKVNLLKALGAQVIRTPTEVASDSPESHISAAKRLQSSTPNSIILDQYKNPNNPLAHYYGTAEEVIEACEDHLDMIVIGAGTGGTISGLAKRLKQRYPGLVVIGVDPLGSILSNPKTPHLQPYQVEGIGYDFIPDVLDRSLIDSWIDSNDRDSFRMARRLIKKEGLLCGGSSGSVAWAAIQAIKSYNYASDPTKRVLILLPDSVRNYMSKFLDPEWMFLNAFMSPEEFLSEQGYTEYADGKESITCSPVTTFKLTDSIESILQQKDTSCAFPVIDPSTNEIIGNFDFTKLIQSILREGKAAALSFNIHRFLNKNFLRYNVEDHIEKVLAAASCNFPVYLVDCSGVAVLSSENLVQRIICTF